MPIGKYFSDAYMMMEVGHAGDGYMRESWLSGNAEDSKRRDFDGVVRRATLMLVGTSGLIGPC